MRSAALFLLAAAAMSAEVSRRDLMIAAEVADGGYDYTLGTPIGDFAGSDAFDRFGVLRLGGRWAFATAGAAMAPLLGIEAELLDAPMADGGMSGQGLALSAGATWAPIEAIAVDLEGFAAMHQCDIELPSAGLAGDGSSQRWGLRTRLMWHPTRHWSLAIEGGWMSWEADLTTDGDRPLVLDGASLTAGLALSWRPSARPGGVE